MADVEVTGQYKGHAITVQIPQDVIKRKDKAYLMKAFDDYHKSR